MQKTAIIKDELAEFLKKMGFSYTALTVTEEEGDIIKANIESEEASLLIGAQGKNLEAMQHLFKSILWQKVPEEKFFLVLDVEDFKSRKQDQIIALAQEKAEAVRATHMTQVLPPMTPFLRRLIHMELAKPEYADITTDSIGEEGHRRVRLIWKGTGSAAPKATADFDDLEV